MANLIYLQWHITNRCNNRCKHCYQSDFGGKYTTKERAKEIIKNFLECCEIFEAQPSIAITGGDPFQNPDFWKILEEIYKNTPANTINIMANPENVTTKNILKLKKFDINQYQISMDGLEETHDRFRYVGSFKRTVKAIKDLVESDIPVTVMSTVSEDNYSEMYQIMSLVYSLGAKSWSFARYIPQNGDCGISPENYLYFMELFKDRMEIKKEPLLTVVRGKLEEIDCVVNGGCGIGHSMLTLLPDDTVMACRRHPGSILGKLTEEKDFFFHLVDNLKMQFYRQIDNIEVCKNCKYLKSCRGCRAAAFCSTQKEGKCDPLCPLDLL